MKAIVLFSGGLDSILAACMLKDQGFEVVGINLITPFHDCSKEAKKCAEEIGIDLVIRSFGQEYVDMLAHPRWGYGSNVNPCLDCRAHMLREAKKLMEEIGAEFVATGEIAGQRPNSQKVHQLTLLNRESGLGGKLLRPLCAKLLPITDVEKDGIVDREAQRAFSGRSRIKLIAYARQKFGLKHIPQPSSGCALCEGSFAPRVRDMLRHKPNPTLWDARVLFCGRRMRIDENAYVVVARNAADCKMIDKLFADPARSNCALIFPENYMGASALLVCDDAPEYGSASGVVSEELQRYIMTACALALRFSNREKFSAVPGGPTARIYLGAGSVVVPIKEDPAVDAIPIISGENRPPKVKDAENAAEREEAAQEEE